MPADFASSLNDTRVKYFHRSEKMSIVENTIAAIENANGDYLCFIGDDDLVAPYVIEETIKLRDSGLDCLIHPPAYYWWSSVEFTTVDRYRHKSAFWLPKAATTEHLCASVELEHMLSNGAVSYYRLPRFYHGIVSRLALQAIYQRTGTFVPGSSPDMAFSVALALVTKRYLHSDRPVTVFGASRGSGGGLTAEGRHHGRIEDQAHLPKSIVERWDLRLPRYWSEYTIYPQTTQEVFQAFGCPSKLNFSALYASILINEPWLWSMTWPLAKRNFGFSPNYWGHFAAIAAKRLAGKAYRGLQSMLGRRPYDVVDCTSLDDCMRELNLRFGRANESVSIT
jgi:glycosyltransferase involved in cell wall biosynthesis